MRCAALRDMLGAQRARRRIGNLLVVRSRDEVSKPFCGAVKQFPAECPPTQQVSCENKMACADGDKPTDASADQAPRPVSASASAVQIDPVIELRPRRVEHELFVDPGSSGGRDRRQRQRLAKCGDQRLGRMPQAR